MAAHTVLLDFTVDSNQTKNESQKSSISTTIENILRDYLSELKQVSTVPFDDSICKLYTSESNVLITIRIFKNGLVTLNIEYYKPDNKEPLFSFERTNQLKKDLSESLLGLLRFQTIPPIKRGSFDRYYPTSDERILEYDIDEVVFNEKSPYQKVQIAHSKSLGNMLVLDDLQNISEADAIYTDTIMAKGIEKYKDKEIVILGGGDGALLYELLKEKPKNVIVLEIDEVVIRACAKHLRSICGDVLDKLEGPNYQIIIGDCMKSLEQFAAEGRKFDYVFGDLTDVPIRDDEIGEHWNFILKVLDYTVKVLKPSGKFMTHGNGACCEESLKKYESLITELNPTVKINKTKAFVPSFLEDWVFYQMTFGPKE
ncbi:spermine synthase isoform X1 [Agrilus planipennis]|uniref:Spermine synthase isoform X1 n=1 Tax=Agrilus planipennis TaxID=224129 RepID=A0A1W4WCH5_AGRPL|nr:spermine synthase isoform X1 [Agrilus planipennis]